MRHDEPCVQRRAGGPRCTCAAGEQLLRLVDAGYLYLRPDYSGWIVAGDNTERVNDMAADPDSGPDRCPSLWPATGTSTTLVERCALDQGHFGLHYINTPELWVRWRDALDFQAAWTTKGRADPYAP